MTNYPIRTNRADHARCPALDPRAHRAAQGQGPRAAWGLLLLALGLGMQGACALPPSYPPPQYMAGEPPRDWRLASIEDLVAPIALYPDDLLAIVLPGATYPLDIVAAERLVTEAAADPATSGNALADPAWDDSIVALLNYPEVLRRMSSELGWTAALGEAVVEREAEVLDAIAAFRHEAFAAGNLRSDEHQTVTIENRIVAIRPTEPSVIYVPYYDPAVVTVYQPVPVIWYYPRAYPVYYYPYRDPYAFDADGYWAGGFWGITAWFSIGWNSHSIQVHHPEHHRHPYHSRIAEYRESRWFADRATSGGHHGLRSIRPTESAYRWHSNYSRSGSRPGIARQDTRPRGQSDQERRHTTRATPPPAQDPRARALAQRWASPSQSGPATEVGRAPPRRAESLAQRDSRRPREANSTPAIASPTAPHTAPRPLPRYRPPSQAESSDPALHLHRQRPDQHLGTATTPRSVISRDMQRPKSAAPRDPANKPSRSAILAPDTRAAQRMSPAAARPEQRQSPPRPAPRSQREQRAGDLAKPREREPRRARERSASSAPSGKESGKEPVKRSGNGSTREQRGMAWR